LKGVLHVVKFKGTCCAAAVAILAAGIGALPLPAQAQTAQAARVIDIPAGTLGNVIAQLGRKAGVMIVFDPALVRGKRASGLRGTYTPTQALDRLLAGSGIQARSDGRGGFTLTRQAPVPSAARARPERIRSGNAVETAPLEDTIIVTAERLPDVIAGGQIARGSRMGLLGNRDVMATPFSTANYTTKFFRDIQARSLAQVLVADPSVRFAGTATRANDGFEIRGFQVPSASQTFDGLYEVSPPLQTALETLERVELVKGPTSLLGGMSPTGSIGGSVNLVPKRAGAAPNLSFTATYGSTAQFGGHIDAGRRFGADQQFGVRINAVYRNGDLALENNASETFDAAIGLDFEQGGLRLTADLGYQERHFRGLDADHYLASGVTILPSPPEADKAHFQPWSFQNADAVYGVARGEYEFSPYLMAYAAAGFSTSRSRLVGSFAYPLEQSGNFSENFWGNAQDYDAVSYEAGLRALVRTGTVQHQLAFAVLSTDREEGFLGIFDGSVVGGLGSNPSNLYMPKFLPAPAAFGIFPNVPRSSTTKLTSYAFADTLVFANDRVLLTLGARHQRVEVTSFSDLGPVTESYDQTTTTPALGLVVKPWDFVSLYGNYSEGLSRGPVASSIAVNAGEVFPPFKSKQIEAGLKVDFGTFLTTVALFEITQPGGILDPDTLVFSVDGERRHRGIELNTFGSPMEGVRLLGGLTLLDAEFTRTEGGANDGITPTGVSEVTVSLGVEWDTPFLQGLTVTARAHYASSFVVNSVDLEAPGRTLVDLGMRYATTALGPPVTLRLNVENATDQTYWATGLDLLRGAPRTVLFSATVDF
jgi:iron complex outermembrane receptor protein